MSEQDPQTAIDYNLYPSSARPSGLEVPQPDAWRDYRQALFNHMAQEHDVHLLESEANDIEQIVFQHPDHLKAVETIRELQAELTATDSQALMDYINENAALADKSSKDWGAAGDKVNEAYRSGMWYAYNDIRNRIPPTLKANFVPTNLEIKQLKAQVLQLKQFIDVGNDREQMIRNEANSLRSKLDDAGQKSKALKKQVESLEKQCAELRTLLQYVAYFRLPLGDTVFDKLDFERQKQVDEFSKPQSTTAGRNYKSPEEVASEIADLSKWCTHLETQLSTHTQALKVAKEALELVCDQSKTGKELDHVDHALATINNLLK